ncbi:hypothetical protein FB567DRAFT_586195 [Paraphoma chrysanthemicola]|uniref:DUF7918 domain-containing protein n=1 Tax=Paraphoma chrysanthemicola TaxID=798071 RepID=A0A8K0RGE8_9PLEO|nr:hypothetical protein FB567DRAFT_586195 [Paraphoma chrysanthemicola]
MAVHPDYPDLQVEVTVDGKPLKEYVNPDETDDPDTITRYIEAVSGAEFALSLAFGDKFPTKHDIGFEIEIDGNEVESSYSAKESLPKVAVIKGAESLVKSKWVLQHFAFSELRITDGLGTSRNSFDQEMMATLGTIAIRLEFGCGGQMSSRPQSYNISALDTVSEFDLKGQAKSHQTGVGSTTPIDTPDFCFNWTSKGGYFATFYFKYRSIAALKSLGIIPRDPSPTPLRSPLPTPSHSVRSSLSIQAQDLRKSTQGPHDIHESLEIHEIIAMIAGHRGRDKGLAGQSRKSLMALLKYYEKQDEQNLSVKHEAGEEDEGAVRIKRERDDGGAAREGSKRRKKEPEIIVLDD